MAAGDRRPAPPRSLQLHSPRRLFLMRDQRQSSKKFGYVFMSQNTHSSVVGLYIRCFSYFCHARRLAPCTFRDTLAGIRFRVASLDSRGFVLRGNIWSGPAQPCTRPYGQRKLRQSLVCAAAQGCSGCCSVSGGLVRGRHEGLYSKVSPARLLTAPY